MTPLNLLRVVKFVHTLVWTFFAGCCFAIPILAWLNRLDAALVLIGLVTAETLVLAVNRWACPLTAVAARYTEERRANFDIYLPEWLARNNKQIFGPLYGAGMIFTAVRWLGWL